VPPFQRHRLRISGQLFGVFQTPIVWRGGIGRVLGGALILRRRRDRRNSYLPIARIKGRLGAIVGNLMFFRRLAHCFTRRSRIRHTVPRRFLCGLAGALGGE